MEYTLSEAEAYIMQYFWQNGAMKTDELAALVSERGWKPTTLLTFLSRLVSKNMLHVQKQGKSNVYSPATSKEEYQAKESRQFLDEMYAGSAKNFLAAMVGSKKLSSKDLQELREWFNQQEVDNE